LKRISLVLILALALTLVFVGSAYANFGPHGGYYGHRLLRRLSQGTQLVLDPDLHAALDASWLGPC
jgi:hypothetical protein